MKPIFVSNRHVLPEGTMAYSPLSLLGPSTSMPIVLPSVENEWQLAHVCRSCMTTRLSGWPM